MVDKERAFDIADHFRATGRRPSVRKLREELRGGSPRRVSEVLRDWREDRGLSEFEADTGVPPVLQTRLDAVTATLWEAARSLSEATFHAESARLEGEKRDAERRLVDTTATLARSEERNRTLATENERLLKRVAAAELHQDRRSREFWDRVAWAAGEIVTEGPLSTQEILNRLPADIRREWAFHDKPRNVVTLGDKLKDRGHWGRYVEALPDGTWKRLTGEANKQTNRSRRKSPGALGSVSV